ncbi:tRNA epoxyqueuosine(34) reductase QueG [Gilvimarinus agarilyticus]|uniref:tRNA epoxyqueuosine(34) reductase QueG n=1 Tax=Gilvimarinus sp. 2_MG-2023 TaxID=3062666 RepID=UPI001C0A5E5D|nr:tRNA epoxyqueuosine(34) reductase QueG [Gilvimarinus sp. 2_MG-2023]MBU2886655.1 tRNA epoxyqueuosine(34) reductase QueG [Gilvimarinus agarilyticus]MDO6571323.1 tRNA epoxyqueuosine(34) reductase QueG [Gilvimarinus sp. 2_MG-2023]
MTDFDFYQLARDIKRWGRELGFQQVGITDTDLSAHEPGLQHWLEQGYQGQMQWMAEHGNKRTRPAELVPGTARVICVRMDYLPGDTEQIKVLKNPTQAYVSRYALGRDYHKLIRKRLAQLGQKIEAALPEGLRPQGEQQNRAFVDSAPVLERPLADKAGLGWTGKHTLILNSEAGSWFFLGELFTYLPLPVDTSEQPNRCGECTACLKVCPTDAFPTPYTLDARRCISYLTIEHKGSIPEEFREPMGNRVFGCDDCQAICPWNKYAKPTAETDFLPRHSLDSADLTTLFQWSEAQFLNNTEGSAIRRIGYERWQRNLAIGLGNAPSDVRIQQALQAQLGQVSPTVDEHIEWALAQQNDPRKRRKRKIKAPPNSG